MTTPKDQISGGSLGHRSSRLGGRTELLTCINLTDRGYDLYRAVGQHSPCDLIAVAGAIVLRVECRTGMYFSNSNKLTFNSKTPGWIDRAKEYKEVVHYVRI